MDALVGVDPVSLTAVLQSGMTGPTVERALAGHGLTLGHYPQSFEYATVGGYAATRSSGQYSLGYGRFDEMVMKLRVATPTGTIEVGRAPRSAAGPDLRQLFLGSEGTLGIITSVTVQVQRAPAASLLESWTFDSFNAGLDAARQLVQSGFRPNMLRISDEQETAINALVEGRSAPPGSLAVVGYEHAQSTREHAAITEFLQAQGACRSDNSTAQAWQQSRFQAPYLRDALLDAGVLVETLETAAFWSQVPDLYAAVRLCLVEELSRQGTPPLVLCHMSHLYPAGAALYFTIACAQADDPIRQWQTAKAAASREILAAGATVTHHHGVGRDHAASLLEEVGSLAVESLRAVKARIDPVGILNPGVLLSS
ncbi:MAG: alkyldihydroxyacetonephosphate synthase, partial [Micromonosporaceae bacterium]|jgi:alkyldihydroxyacetonephosphate synthase|nr:alkyldihydroxyacetonephosphate synthase [Micromonosporaceae bacterium]